MVESKNVFKGSEDVDIGCGNSFGGGGEDEGVDNAAVTVNNIVDSFQYTGEISINGSVDRTLNILCTTIRNS